jgi:hypothetical protein
MMSLNEIEADFFFVFVDYQSGEKFAIHFSVRD